MQISFISLSSLFAYSGNLGEFYKSLKEKLNIHRFLRTTLTFQIYGLFLLHYY